MPRQIAKLYTISLTKESTLFLRSFLLMLRAEGISASTVVRYESSVRAWQLFAESEGFPSATTRDHVSQFLASRRETLAPNTARNDLMALRRYFRFLVEEGDLAGDPTLKIRPPRVEEHIPNPYTPAELQAMLKASQGRTFDALRNTALVMTLLDTGLRAAECCGLMMSDIELDAERIRVRGKGRRERFVRLGLRAQRAIDRYLRVRRDDRPELWLNRRREPVTASGLFQIIRRVCREAGVANPGVHRFRHTAATTMRELGIADQDLMSLLGWSTPSMALRYTRAGARERALRAHRAVSPADHLTGGA